MNNYRFIDNYCFIEILSKKYGRFDAIIDFEDYKRVKNFQWSIRSYTNTIYIGASIDCGVGSKFNIQLHRYIMSFPENMQVDHINRNGLDNRKSNLRIVFPYQNSINRKRNPSNSGYRGVHFRRGKYEANIAVQNKKIYIGTFFKLDDAINAYNEAAKKYHGEYAIFNNLLPS